MLKLARAATLTVRSSRVVGAAGEVGAPVGLRVSPRRQALPVHATTDATASAAAATRAREFRAFRLLPPRSRRGSARPGS